MLTMGRTIINKHKSSVFFSKNFRVLVICYVTSILGLKKTPQSTKYFILFVGHAKNQASIYRSLKIQLRRKLVDEKQKFYSKQQLDPLLRSVALVLFAHYMSTFFLLRSFCDPLFGPELLQWGVIGVRALESFYSFFLFLFQQILEVGHHPS